MVYPKLKNTPIKEIVFSISYQEIIDTDCFEKFINLEKISARFKVQKALMLEIRGNNRFRQESETSRFHLKNENEVLQLRKGSFSYHYLNSHKDYDSILNILLDFWNDFTEQVKGTLTVTSISIRYINVLDTDEDNTPSRLVQLYPKYSSDRKIDNFQNSVQFSYNNFPDYMVNVVSAKPQKNFILLDITVYTNINNDLLKDKNLKELFNPLQEIKNRAFFDSITAKALLKYI